MAVGDLTAEQQVRRALTRALDLLERAWWSPVEADPVKAEIREALKRMDEAGAA